MLTLSLALAIAGGGNVWEWRCDKPKRVLIVDGEMHLQDIKERLEMLIDTGAVQGIDLDAVRNNLVIIARQAQDPDSTFFDISNYESQQDLLKRVKAERTDVLIIDNLTTVADGLPDENDATAFRSIMSFMLRTKQAGLTTLLVHHSRKDGNAARGSSALDTTFEVILGLKKPTVPPADRASFVTNFTKFRARGNASLVPQQWTLNEDGWKVEDDGDDALVQTIEAFKSLRFSTQAEAAKHLGVSPATMTRRVAKIDALGLSSTETLRGYLESAKDLRLAEASGLGVDLDDNDGGNEEF